MPLPIIAALLGSGAAASAAPVAAATTAVPAAAGSIGAALAPAAAGTAMFAPGATATMGGAPVSSALGTVGAGSGGGMLAAGTGGAAQSALGGATSASAAAQQAGSVGNMAGKLLMQTPQGRSLGGNPNVAGGGEFQGWEQFGQNLKSNFSTENAGKTMQKLQGGSNVPRVKARQPPYIPRPQSRGLPFGNTQNIQGQLASKYTRRY